MKLPEFIKTVVLLRDNDGDNAASRKAFDRAVWWFRGQSKTVKVINVPVGKDLNDYWQQARGAA